MDPASSPLVPTSLNDSRPPSKRSMQVDGTRYGARPGLRSTRWNRIAEEGARPKKETPLFIHGMGYQQRPEGPSA